MRSHPQNTGGDRLGCDDENASSYEHEPGASPSKSADAGPLCKYRYGIEIGYSGRNADFASNWDFERLGTHVGPHCLYEHHFIPANERVLQKFLVIMIGIIHAVMSATALFAGQR